MKKKKITIYLILLLIGSCLLIVYRQGITKLAVTSQELNVKKYLGLNHLKYKQYTGNNVTVAIIDSGIGVHKDIDQSRILAFKDFVNQKDTPYDDNGHGTFVAGIIGGNGNYVGIAPNVNLVVLKVVNSTGDVDTSNLYNAIEWVYNNKEKYNIDIVNISIGSPITLPIEKDPLCIAVKKLKSKGIIIACSAGNYGPSEATITSPGMSPDVITVGYLNNKNTYKYKDDTVAYMSGRGNSKNIIQKPDIITLGVDILSLSYKNGYKHDSGSSFATAIVSGVAAILTEKYKNKPSSFIEEIIKGNTYKLENVDNYSQGNGELKFK